MRKSRWVIYGLAFCVCSAAAQLERRFDKSHSWGTLNQQEFLQLLIQRSVEVQYSKIATDISSHLMQGEAGLYETNFFMSARNEGRDRQRTAEERFLINTTANTTILDESSQSRELGIRGKLPWGTELSVSYKASNKSNNLIPQYSSSKYDTEFNTLLSVIVKQPLLRNAGRDITETDLQIAKLERESSLLQFRQQMLKTSIEGLTDYWRLYRAEATLALRKSAYASSESLLSDADARVRAGKLAATARLDARALLLNRRAEVTRSEQALREAQGKIATALNISWKSNTELSTQPVLQSLSSLLDGLPQTSDFALNMWLPYQIAKVKYQQAKLRLDYAKNQMMPVVDLVFGYNGTGYSYDAKVARLASEKWIYPDWYVGVNVELPLQNNRKARHQFLAQNSRLIQAELELAAISNSFINDLVVRHDDLLHAQKVLKISNEEVDIRQQAFLYERQRFELGVGLLAPLIQKQIDLIESQQRLLENQVRFEIALATWKYTQSTLLEDYQIEITGQLLSPQ